MYQELLGQELAPGDIVAYPSGQSLDYAVITKITTMPFHPYELHDGYRLSTKVGMIEGKQFYMLRRWSPEHQQLVNKGFRMRRKELSDRVLLKLSEEAFMESPLSQEEKRAVLTFIQEIKK